MENASKYMNYEQLAALILGSRYNRDFPINIGCWDNCYAMIYDSTASMDINNERAKRTFSDTKQSIDMVINAPKATPQSKATAEKLKQVYNQLEEALKNPYEEQSKAFLDRMTVLLRLTSTNAGRRENAEQERLMVLNKIKQFTDEKAKYDALSFFVFNTGTESARIATILRANSPHATAADIGRVLDLPDYRAQAKPVFERLEQLAVKEISDELAKETPDLNKIKNTCKIIVQGSYATRDDSLMQTISQQYTIENLLRGDPTELNQKLEESKLLQIDQKNQQINALNQQITQLNQQIAELQTRLETEQRAKEYAIQEKDAANRQIEQLKQKLTSMQSENTKLAQAKASKESKLQRLIQGADHLKSGLGSRGVNDYKRLVAELRTSGDSEISI